MWELNLFSLMFYMLPFIGFASGVISFYILVYHRDVISFHVIILHFIHLPARIPSLFFCSKNAFSSLSNLQIEGFFGEHEQVQNA